MVTYLTLFATEGDERRRVAATGWERERAGCKRASGRDGRYSPGSPSGGVNKSLISTLAIVSCPAGRQDGRRMRHENRQRVGAPAQRRDFWCHPASLELRACCSVTRFSTPFNISVARLALRKTLAFRGDRSAPHGAYTRGRSLYEYYALWRCCTCLCSHVICRRAYRYPERDATCACNAAAVGVWRAVRAGLRRRTFTEPPPPSLRLLLAERAFPTAAMPWRAAGTVAAKTWLKHRGGARYSACCSSLFLPACIPHSPHFCSTCMTFAHLLTRLLLPSRTCLFSPPAPFLPASPSAETMALHSNCLTPAGNCLGGCGHSNIRPLCAIYHYYAWFPGGTLLSP